MRRWEDYKKTMIAEDSLFGHARAGDLHSLMMRITPQNLNSQDSKGYSALMLAAYNGHLEAARWLIEVGAEVNQPDHSGNSILMGAAFKGHLEVVKLLVHSGAQIEARNPQGQTALEFAQMFGRSDVALFLKSKLNKPEVFGLKDIFSGWVSFLFSKRRSS